MNTTKAPSRGRSRPSEVQERLASLQEARNRVTELRELLALAEIEYNRLETEWFSYEASITPIRKCPPEITLMVFEFYLLENPRLIRRLLPVCKQWYEIASGAPQLWNHILVEFNNDWDVEAVSNAINRRVEACIRRSGSLPLDLHLDFRHLSYIRGKIASRLDRFMEDLVGPTPGGGRTFFDYMDSLREGDFAHLPEGIQPAHALSVLRKLIGEHGTSACRWRSLELRLPEYNDTAARQILACFTCPTPNLTRMAILDFDSGLQRYDGHLKMDGKPGLGRINAQNSPLESLTVLGTLEFWASYSLSRFGRLERLEPRYDHSASVRPAGELYFTFPELWELTLHGEFKGLDMVKFRVPQLRFLTTNRQPPMSLSPRTPYRHPKVQPIVLHWEVTEEWSWSRSINYIRSEMRETLLRYPTAEHFRTQSFLRDLLIQIVRKLHLEGKLPSALKSVTFEGEEGQLEMVDLRDLLVDQ